MATSLTPSGAQLPPPSGSPAPGLRPPPTAWPASTLPPPPPPPSRWGLGDVLIGAAVILGVATLVGVVAVLIVGLPEAGDATATAEALAEEPLVLVSSVLAQQVAMVGWVVWVARVKGRGVIEDFGFRFKWVDLAIGVAAAIAALVVTGVVVGAVASATGIEAVDNSDFIQPSEQGLWIIPIGLMVVVGAPLSEELFFRGLVFRAAEKKWSTVVGIAFSTVVFALVHALTGISAAENLILILSIAVFGVALAVVAAQYRRLGPAIVAHMAINGFAFAAIVAG
ncbi:MAG: CPBP family intramembrane glutamic endopeptidase [Acidimicrobiales bacterium]